MPLHLCLKFTEILYWFPQILISGVQFLFWKKSGYTKEENKITIEDTPAWKKPGSTFRLNKNMYLYNTLLTMLYILQLIKQTFHTQIFFLKALASYSYVELSVLASRFKTVTYE